MKVVFLDIDGVLQPSNNQQRFKHIDEIDDIIARLNQEIPQYADWQQYLKHGGAYDITAVMYDWDEAAVKRLHNILETTGAKIVLSTDWRYKDTPFMRALLSLHGFDKYLVGSTYFIKDYSVSCGDENYKERYEHVEVARSAYREFRRKLQKSFEEDYPPKQEEDKWYYTQVDDRAVEIREYLDCHPEVTSYVALDDRNLTYGLDGHAVVTRRGVLLPENEAEAIAILSKEDGPYALPKACKTPLLDEWRATWRAEFEKKEAECY